MKFLGLILLFWGDFAFADSKFPEWILNQKLSDDKFQYVICSHENGDPEVAKKQAELECLANIMKLSGVRTVTSEKMELTLNDNKYEANIISDGVEGNIRCEFTDIFNEKLVDSYRVWLKCKIAKSELVKYSKENRNGEISYGPKPLFDQIRKLEIENKKLKDKESRFTFLDNGRVVRASADKLIEKFVFTGMSVGQLMNKINPRFLLYSTGSGLCQRYFSNDEMYALDDSKICISGINGIVIGICNSDNSCVNK